jgi:hypothetical protein
VVGKREEKYTKELNGYRTKEDHQKIGELK